MMLIFVDTIVLVLLPGLRVAFTPFSCIPSRLPGSSVGALKKGVESSVSAPISKAYSHIMSYIHAKLTSY